MYIQDFNYGKISLPENVNKFRYVRWAVYNGNAENADLKLYQNKPNMLVENALLDLNDNYWVVDGKALIHKQLIDIANVVESTINSDKAPKANIKVVGGNPLSIIVPRKLPLRIAHGEDSFMWNSHKTLKAGRKAWSGCEKVNIINVDGYDSSVEDASEVSINN